jgi:hypothetical protein
MTEKRNCRLFAPSSIFTESLHYLRCFFTIDDYYIFVSSCGYAIWVGRSESILNGCCGLIRRTAWRKENQNGEQKSKQHVGPGPGCTGAE